MKSPFKLLQYIFFILLLVISKQIVAAQWNGASHRLYSGDYNGDGLVDVFLKGALKFVPIAGEILIPLTLPTEHTDYVLLQQGNGTYTVVYSPGAALTEAVTWQDSQHLVHVGDFNGDGLTDFFLQGKSNGIKHISLMATSTGMPQVANVYTSGELVASKATLAVWDVDGDGYLDLAVTTNTGQDKVAYGGGSGVFAQVVAMPYDKEGTEIGSIAGNFRVNESGSAAYVIPLMLPRGTAGVTPQLSMNYSSHSGNGLLGLGWSLQGLSIVARCRQTLGQDGQALPISWSNQDRFCLDGHRLLVQGGKEYGSVGAIYKTEIDSFVTITSVGGSDGNPAYFTVERKDGSISTYGGNSSSLQKNSDGIVMTWGQSEFRDSIGNPIKYFYYNDSDGYRIRRIDYSYGAGALPVSIVNFIYEQRSDDLSGYVAGYQFFTKNRLQKIEVTEQGEEVRSYLLGYKPSLSTDTNQLSKIELVKECVQDKCLPATEFGWTEPQLSFSSTASSISLGGSHSRDLGAHNFKPADINGDGMMDIVWFYYLQDGTSDVDYVLRYALSDGNKLVLADFSNGSNGIRYNNDAGLKYEIIDYNADGRQDVVVKNGDSGNWKVHLSKLKSDGSGWVLSSGTISTNISNAKAVFSDFNSDGLSDVAYVDPSSNATGLISTGDLGIHYLVKNPNKAVSSSSFYKFSGDINPVYEHQLMGIVFRPSGVYKSGMDWNGDGIQDLLIPYQELGAFEYGEVAVIVKNGDISLYPMVSEYQDFRYQLQTADFNLDGLSDIFYVDERKYLCFELNDGVGFDRQANETCYAANAKNNLRTVDYNLDGYPDVVWHSKSEKQLKVKMWDPAKNQFKESVSIRGTNGEGKHAHLFFDVNGDGVSDYVKFKDDKLRTYLGMSNEADFKIDRITNGFGAVTEITYEPLSRSDHYEQLTVKSESQETEVCYQNECFNYFYSVTDVDGFYEALNGDWTESDSLGKTGPVLNLNGPMSVVTKVSRSSPQGTSKNAKSSISYYYSEAKLQASGRGFLGFQKFKTIDDQSGVQTTTTYRQDWPFIGYPLKTVIQSAEGHLLSESSNVWSLTGYSSDWKAMAVSSGTAALGSLQPFIKQSSEKIYSLINNGSVQGELLQEFITTNSYDTFGNPTQINVVTKDGSGTTVSQKQTSNLYGTTDWYKRMGRLTETTVTTTRGGSSGVRKSRFTYNTTGNKRGLLASEVIEPDLPEYQLTTSYEYDSFGNKIKATQAANGNASRMTQTQYDALGRYPVLSKNGYGQITEQVIARNNLGQVLRVKDINGVSQYNTFTPMGVLSSEVSDTGASQQMSVESCDGNCPATGVYLVRNRSASGAESKVYYDLLNREVRRAVRRFNGGWSFVDTEYDNLGRVLRKSEPHAGVAQYWTVISYDLLGRAVSTQLPGISTPVTVSYAGLTTVTTNSEGQQKTEVKNVLGELIRVTDHLGGRLAYQYDVHGNLLKVTSLGAALDAHNIPVTMTYDRLGRKLSIVDPDKGSWSYEYNGYGELIKQTDAKGQNTEMTYDKLGRMVTRIDRRADGVTESNVSWIYNNDLASTAGVALGALSRVQDSVSGYIKVLGYDSLGRLDETVTSLAANDDHYEKVTYDAVGRTSQVFDAAGDATWQSQGIQNHYNAYGYLNKVTDVEQLNGKPKATYYTVQEMDLRGNVTQAVHGNSVVDNRFYDSATGRLLTLRSDLATGLGKVQDHTYEWDDLGNLLKHYDYSGDKNLVESFVYDGLNRLTSAQVTGKTAQTLQYNSLGNITHKSDVGNYTYGENGHGPHAVTSTSDGVQYTYDANGNMTRDTAVGNLGGRTIQYTTFDKPFEITKGSHTTEFKYGPDRTRYLRTDTNTDGVTVTRYIGSVEKVTHPDGSKEFKRYIGSALVTIVKDASGTTTGETVRYLHKDHLGSVDVITDALGNVVQALSFDAWGQRRNAVDWSQLDIASLLDFDASITPRGFTGHEMLDEVGLVHMNGRIYDARLGRFLQADPHVDGIYNTQGYNRYSYLHNNPLNATDPTGYFKFGDFIKAVVQAVITYAVGTVCPPCAAVVAFGFAKMNGATSGQAFFAAALAWAGAEMGAAGSGESASVSSTSQTTADVLTENSASHLAGGQTQSAANAALAVDSSLPEVIVMGTIPEWGITLTAPQVALQAVPQLVGINNGSPLDNLNYRKAEIHVIDNSNVMVIGRHAYSLSDLTLIEQVEAIAGTGTGLLLRRSGGAKGLSGLETRGVRPQAGTRVKPEGIPDNWKVRPSRSKGGVKYSDPTNPRVNVRVEQGVSGHPHANSRVPHVRDMRNGQYVDKYGNPVQGGRTDPAGHIPLDEYRYIP